MRTEVAPMPEAHGSTAVSAGTAGTTAAGTALLEVENLTAAYGPVRALDGVTLSAEAGRITAVLGANGAGKTTLLRTISGLVRPQAGTVRLGGQDITRAPVEAMVGKGMSHVPEGRGVIAELTVDENLRVGALFRGKAPKEEFDGSTSCFHGWPSGASSRRTTCPAASPRAPFGTAPSRDDAIWALLEMSTSPTMRATMRSASSWRDRRASSIRRSCRPGRRGGATCAPRCP